MIQLFEQALKYFKEHKAMAFVTLVSVSGSAPQIEGAKMLVVDTGDRHLTYGTIGGGNLEFTAIEDALAAIREGKPKLVEKNLGKDLSMACGGNVAYFIEPLTNPATLVICGAGHVGLALFNVMKDIGFRTVIVDSMAEYANSERFAGANQIIASFDEAVLDKELHTDKNTYIVIVSRDHPTDFRLTRFFVNKEWRYLGVIASRTKAAILMKELKEEGYSEENIARITAPIGLPIGGASPAEIAISVAAQIVQEKNKPQ